MKPVADQDFWNAWRMLVDLLKPSIDAFEAPLVGNIINQENTLSSTRIRPDDGAKAALTGGVPQLQLHTLPVDENDCLFEAGGPFRSAYEGGVGGAVLQAC